MKEFNITLTEKIKLINCKKVKKLLPGYIDDMLKEKARTKVKEHLTGCSNCKIAEEDSRKIKTIIKAFPRIR
ncbi:MAG: zf-HC2 domain-containing protein [PVC group bacterium]|nr:zf-HC2 domain-containing protein [PVC group bacterium]